jgi:3-oxoacyl-[acyl-carrier-protein] synthase III
MSVEPSRPIAVRILGTRNYLPTWQMHADDVDRRRVKPAGRTLRHAGVGVRHYAGADEPASLMGERAARVALAAAQLQPHEVGRTCASSAPSAPAASSGGGPGAASLKAMGLQAGAQPTAATIAATGLDGGLQ